MRRRVTNVMVPGLVLTLLLSCFAAAWVTRVVFIDIFCWSSCRVTISTANDAIPLKWRIRVPEPLVTIGCGGCAWYREYERHVVIVLKSPQPFPTVRPPGAYPAPILAPQEPQWSYPYPSP